MTIAVNILGLLLIVGSLATMSLAIKRWIREDKEAQEWLKGKK